MSGADDFECACCEKPGGLSHAERLARAGRLLERVTDTPRLDAEILLARALGMPRAKLLASLGDCAEAPGFDAMLERRLAFEPLAYILGEWEFFSMTFSVRSPLLAPRPETEHLVEIVLEHVQDRPARILEIGTGTGCVACAIAHHAPQCRVIATDIEPFALETARDNAARHHVADRITFREGRLFDLLGEDETPFDAICSNPPYVEDATWSELPPVIRLHEDPRALLAGHDGLAVIRPVIAQAYTHLRPGGLLALEMGDGHRPAVDALLHEHGYEAIGFRRDLAGIERIAFAHRPAGPGNDVDSLPTPVLS